MTDQTVGSDQLVRSMRPVPFGLLREAEDAATRAVSPDLMRVCRARIRSLMGRPLDSDDPRVASIADYAVSPLYSEAERLALEFTEQYIMDVSSMPEQLVADLQDRLGPAGLYGFVLALQVVDQSERLALTAALHPEIGKVSQ
jgi:hypothetical protein